MHLRRDAAATSGLACVCPAQSSAYVMRIAAPRRCALALLFRRSISRSSWGADAGRVLRFEFPAVLELWLQSMAFLPVFANRPSRCV